MERIEQLADHMKLLHKGQKDKTGAPYWYHCIHVGNICEVLFYVAGSENLQMENIAVNDMPKTITMTALFHDVIEDVPNGEEELKNILTPDEFNAIIFKLHLLTKKDDMPYDEYINKIINSGDKITLLVKFADMIDHIERLPLIEDEKTRKRLQEKYREPYKLLRQKFVEMAGAITMPYPVQAKSKNKRKMKFWSGK